MIRFGKTFWTILVGVNSTSLMMSAFAGSKEGVIFCSVGLISAAIMLSISDKLDELEDK